MAQSSPGIKLHTKNRIVPGPSAKVEDDVISFSSGGSVALVKILEPVSPMLNYFEYEILNRGGECAIGIGVGALNYPQGRMPGWNKDSIGYHADDGKLFHERGFGANFGPTCTTGDKMGCGIDYDTDVGFNYVRIFFTKNGKQIGQPQKMKRPVHGLYPMFGLHSEGEKIRYLGHWHLSPENLQEVMQQNISPSSHWIRANGIKFLEDGLTLEYASEGGNIQDVAIAQANFPINSTNHYFELEILDAGVGGSIAIGLAKLTYPLHRHPGWNPGAVGYHADDGKMFKERGVGMDFGPTCTTGDIMGCGVRFTTLDDDFDDNDSESDTSIPDESLGRGAFLHPALYYSDSDEDYEGDIFGGPPPLFGLRPPRGFPRLEPPIQQKSPNVTKDGKKITVYFTKNGEELGDTECTVPSGGFYPVVAMLSRGEKIKVNLYPLSG